MTVTMPEKRGWDGGDSCAIGMKCVFWAVKSGYF
nr:hypothetical protein [Tanacetum cinerariifolium]